MNDLLERKALNSLQNGDFQEALKLFSEARTSHQFIVSSSINYGYFCEVINYIKDLLSYDNDQMSPLLKTHFANLSVYCYARQLQQLKNVDDGQEQLAKEKGIKEDLKRFIQTCEYYDEKKVISLLVENELYDIARCCAESKSIMATLLQELEVVLKQSPNQQNHEIAALICEFKGDMKSSMEYQLEALSNTLSGGHQIDDLISKSRLIFSHHVLGLLHNPRGAENIVELFLNFASKWPSLHQEVENIVFEIINVNHEAYLFGIIFLLYLCKKQRVLSTQPYNFTNKFVLELTALVMEKIENCTSIDMSSPTIMDMFSNEDDFFIFDAIRQSMKFTSQ